MGHRPIAPTVDGRDLIVLAAGLGTTLVAFICVWLADRAGEHLMGQYGFLWGLIPLPTGAFFVGIVASLGYGAGSFLTQRKVSGRLLWTVAGLLVGSYFVAQYVEYRMVVSGLGDEAIGFWSFFDHVTRAFAWQDAYEKSGHGSALGELGYALRALELAGFVGGGVIVPAALRNKPYCDRCRCYRQSKLVAIVPVGAEEADAHRRLQVILRAARAGSFDEVVQAIVTNGPLSTRREVEGSAHQWLSANLLYCPKCADGAIVAKTHQRQSERHGRRHATEIATEVVELNSDLVRRFLGRHEPSAHPYR
jgi:hypothetical protein